MLNVAEDLYPPPWGSTAEQGGVFKRLFNQKRVGGLIKLLIILTQILLCQGFVDSVQDDKKGIVPKLFIKTVGQIIFIEHHVAGSAEVLHQPVRFMET